MAALKCARRLQPYGKTIVDATDHYIRYLEDSQRSCTVAQLREEFLESQRKAKRSIRHQQDFVCLERLNLTESQGRDAINYRAGQVVEFHRRAQGGFKSGEKWEVIASDEKGVTVSRAGKQTLLPLTQANSFELSERREIALAAGDSVRTTKNFRCGADRFTNNELCRIAAIDQASIHLDDGRLSKSLKQFILTKA